MVLLLVRRFRLFDNNLLIDQLLLYEVAMRIKAEMLGIHPKLGVDHSPAGAVFLQGKDDPVAVTFALVRIEGDMFFGEDVELIVHDNGNITLIIKGGAAAQVVEVHALAS